MPTSQIAEMVRQVVNRTGQSEAQQIIEENGRIKMTAAAGTVINTGKISTNGANGKAAGSVEIISDRATLIAAGSNISADGQGAGSDGGKILMLSDSKNGRAVLEKGADISARGGNVSGNGGFVELSGSKFFWASNADVSATKGKVARSFLTRSTSTSPTNQTQKVM